VLFDESFDRILKPRIYIEIYSAKDKLSVSVEESSSEHKQGLNPERERERERESYTVGHCCSATKI